MIHNLHKNLRSKLSRKKFKDARFSKKRLTIYGLAFAITGGATLYLIFAAGPAPDGSWETGMGTFTNLECEHPATQFARVTAAAGPVKAGNYAAKFHMTPSDVWTGNAAGLVRCLTSSASGETPGDEFYYSLSMYIPYIPTSTDPLSAGKLWKDNLVWELHHGADLYNVPGCGVAPFALFTSGPDNEPLINFRVVTGNCTPTVGNAYSSVTPITNLNPQPLNQWIDFVIHIKFTEANTGVVEVYDRIGGGAWTKQVNLSNIPTMPFCNSGCGWNYPTNPRPVHNQALYTEMGLYHGAPNYNRSDTIYLDDYRRELTLAAAQGDGSTPVVPDPTSIQYDSSNATTAYTGFGTTNTQNFTVANNNNRILVAYVQREFRSGNNNVASVKYNNVPLTKLTSAGTTSTADTEIWYLLNPDTGTHPLVLDFNGGTSMNYRWGASSYYNVKQVVPTNIYNSGLMGTTVSTATNTLAGTTTGSLVLDLLAGSGTGLTSVTSDAGQTKVLSITDRPGAGGYGNITSSYKTGGGSITTRQTAAAGTLSAWSYMQLELLPPDVVPVLPVPANTAVPTVSGTTTVGQTLTSTTGTWDNSPTSYSYQWQACDSSGNNCANISGASSSTYLLTSSELAKTIKSVVTATNASGGASASSVATAAVIAATPPSVPTPTITQNITAGQTLTGTITWTATVTANASSISQVVFAMDGNTNNTTVLSPGPYERVLNTRTLTDGTHSMGLTVTLTDGTVVYVPYQIGNVTVDNADHTQPSTPTSLLAATPDPTTVNLSWSASNDAVGVTAYKLYRGQNSATPTLYTTLGNVTSYSDTPVSADTTYTYRVSAVDAAGNESILSTALTVSTPPVPDTTAPAVSITAPATNAEVSGNSVNITTTATDNVAIAQVQLYLDYQGNPASNLLGPAITTGSGSSYSYAWDTTTLSNTSHTLTAIATDTSTNATTSTTITVTVNNPTPPTPDTTPPTVPTNLTAGLVTTDALTVFWLGSTDPVTSGQQTTGVASYNLYRNGIFLQNTGLLLAYDDANLTPDTTYSYQVSALDNAGNESAKTAVVSAKTIAVATPTPVTPTPTTTASQRSRGDLNNDQHITVIDLSILLSSFNRRVTASTSGDTNGDGIVNVIDLSILLSNYGR